MLYPTSIVPGRKLVQFRVQTVEIIKILLRSIQLVNRGTLSKGELWNALDSVGVRMSFTQASPPPLFYRGLQPVCSWRELIIFRPVGDIQSTLEHFALVVMGIC